jgi:hypothetical protein
MFILHYHYPLSLSLIIRWLNPTHIRFSFWCFLFRSFVRCSYIPVVGCCSLCCCSKWWFCSVCFIFFSVMFGSLHRRFRFVFACHSTVFSVEFCIVCCRLAVVFNGPRTRTQCCRCRLSLSFSAAAMCCDCRCCCCLCGLWGSMDMGMRVCDRMFRGSQLYAFTFMPLCLYFFITSIQITSDVRYNGMKMKLRACKRVNVFIYPVMLHVASSVMI